MYTGNLASGRCLLPLPLLLPSMGVLPEKEGARVLMLPSGREVVSGPSVVGSVVVEIVVSSPFEEEVVVVVDESSSADMSGRVTMLLTMSLIVSPICPALLTPCRRSFNSMTEPGLRTAVLLLLCCSLTSVVLGPMRMAVGMAEPTSLSIWSLLKSTEDVSSFLVGDISDFLLELIVALEEEELEVDEVEPIIGPEAISTIDGDRRVVESVDGCSVVAVVDVDIELPPLELLAEAVDCTSALVRVITVGEISSMEERMVLVPLKSVIKCVSVVCVEMVSVAKEPSRLIIPSVEGATTTTLDDGPENITEVAMMEAGGAEGMMVRVMVTGSRSVRYSVFTSSSGVMRVCVPLKSVAK